MRRARGGQDEDEQMAKALSPSDVRNSQGDRDGPLVEQAIKAVNAALMNHDGEDRMAIGANILGKGNVRARVEQEFRQAGWSIQFQDDQRDGAFYWFRAPRTR